MFPLLISVGLFLFYALLGKALLDAVRFPFPSLRTWLIAPGLGVAAVIVAVMILSQAGLPVARFGRILFSTALLFLAVIWHWRKPVFSRRELAPFLLASLLSVVYTGSPLVIRGAAWLGNASFDMTGYTLGAQRLLENGFYRLPTASELLGRDYIQYFWFLHVPGMFRLGGEYSLAWLSAVTGQSVFRSYMPLMLALFAAFVCAVGALVLEGAHRVNWALVTMLLVATAPILSSATYQLFLAQACGMPTMFVLITILLSCRPENNRQTVSSGAIAGLTASGFLIAYPEVTGFVVASVAVYVTASVLRNRKLPDLRYGLLLCLTVTLSVLLLRNNILGVVISNLNGAGQGLSAAKDLSKEFYTFAMLPTSFGDLFGFSATLVFWPEPWASVSVISGHLLFAVSLVFGLSRIFRPSAFSSLFLVTALVGASTFAQHNDYGVLKWQFFMCPLALAIVGLGISKVAGYKRAALTLIFCCATVPAYTKYLRVAPEYRKVIGLSEDPLPRVKGSNYIADVHNVVAASVLADLLQGQQLVVPNRGYFIYFEGTRDALRRLPRRVVDMLPASYQRAGELKKVVSEGYVAEAALGTKFISFSPTAWKAGQPTYLITLAADETVLNGVNKSEFSHSDRYVRYAHLSDVANWLIDVDSTLGNHYHNGDRTRINLYQTEPDVMNPGAMFAAEGRFMLLRIINPSGQVRLRLDLTRSVIPGFERLPLKATVKGLTIAHVHFAGSGSAIAYSEPVVPLRVGDEYYLLLDLGEDGAYFPSPRAWWKNLYFADVRYDTRRISAYCRDLSAISEMQYEGLQRPASLAFSNHEMLQERSVEFSGFYEDGWMSDVGEVVLGKPQDARYLDVKGMLPGVTGQPQVSTLRVSVNRKVVLQQSIGVGRFAVHIPAETFPAISHIELHFDNPIHLQVPDQRSIGAAIYSVGFKSR